MSDRNAAPVIRTPDQRLRVFVSSTLGELAEERAAARDGIRHLHLAPVLFELGARPHPPRELYRAYLDQSHIFIGIYWQSYGWVAPDEAISGLEDEYELSGDRPKLIYVKRPAPHREARLSELLDRVRNDDAVSYKPFDSAEELRDLIEEDLMVLLSERFETPIDEGRRPLRSNLPAAVDRFIGRAHQLEEIKDRLGQTRLVTLLGTGGTGKTRLAVQAATELLDAFEDRVYFADLSASRELESVLSVIARALGVREETNRALLDDLKAQIGTQKTLVLLDNFEQVVAAAAPTMLELLRDCPELKLLVTSREPLRVSGENLLPVPPLTLPRLDLEKASVEQLAQSEAVQLFVERARAVKPDFRLTLENADAIVQLCTRLDGLPLAIELATARLGLFSPRALVERLGSRLTLLRGGARDAPARQQTLRDTIAWSYNMLDSGEQQLFELLSLFSGASFEAMEDVVGRVPGLDTVDVVDGLSSLVDKSLVRRMDYGEGSRFSMLETIREFASERLDERPESSAACRRAHASYFAGWVQRQWEPLIGDGRDAALDHMAVDLENIQTAWRYWVGENDFEQLSKFTDSLWLLYDTRGWYHATVSLANDLLALLSSTPSTPERVLEEITLQTSLARVLMTWKGYSQEVEDAYTRALELCEREGEVPQLLPVLRGLSSFYIYRADFESGARIGQQILDLAARYDDDYARVEGHLVHGASMSMLDRLEDGMKHLEEGIAAYDPELQGPGRYQLGNNAGVACFTTSALVLWMLGFPDQAGDRANEAIGLSNRLNHPSSIAYAGFHVGLLHLWKREEERARECAQSVADIAAEHEYPIWAAVASCLLGAVMASTGSTDEGLSLFDEAMQNYRRLRTPPVFWPPLLSLQAGVCGSAGRPEDGLRLIDEAIETATLGPGRVLRSEYFRVKGELLLAVSGGAATDAESWLQRAVDTATDVHAPMLQLRAATSLSRAWCQRAKTEPARTLLRDAYERFTEGFATADLRDARGLLDELAVVV